MSLDTDALPSLAILGAGLFVRDTYVKVLQELREQVKLRFVWSRTQAAAESVAALCASFAPAVEARYGEEGLQEILQHGQIHAVAVALAAQVQPEIVARALRAGKHVLQEKPAAVRLEQGLATLRVYQEIQAQLGKKAPMWAVAENYRFEPGVLEAARAVKGLGEMMAVEMNVENPTKTNKYSDSKWRRDPEFYGTFILEGAVHFIAALRLVTGCEVTAVSALASHVDKGLPPPDNLSGLLRLSNGCACAAVISFGATSRHIKWRVICASGTVELERVVKNQKHGYAVATVHADGRKDQSFHPFAGVQHEMASFVKDIGAVLQSGESSLHPLSSATEGLRDLAVVEVALQSSTEESKFLQVPTIM